MKLSFLRNTRAAVCFASLAGTTVMLSSCYSASSTTISSAKTQELKTLEFSRQANGEFKQVSIPHSMNATNGTGTIPLERGDAYYRQIIKVSKEDLEKDYILQFEQVGQVSEVSLNGKLLHKNYSGYTPFAVKLDGLVEGDNTVVIHTNNRRDGKILPSAGDFNFTNGILGRAFLITGNLYFDPQVYGIDKAHVVPVSVKNDSVTFGIATSVFSKAQEGTAQIAVTLQDADGTSVLAQRVPLAVIPGNNEFYKEFTFKNPILWQAKDNPYLYHVKIELSMNGSTYDVLDIPYGFRDIQLPYKANETLLRINDKPVRLRGVCMHQDFPNAGAAMTEENRDVDRAILKEIGCNWIRCAHYPHNVNEFAYYDKVGLMTQTEIPWVDYYDGSQEFAEHVMQYVHDMINNLYNHPSIILWGLSNEIWFSSHSDAAVKLHNDAYMLGRRLDPYRPVGFVTREQQLPTISRNSLIADWYGNNPYPGWYSRKNFLDDTDLVTASQPIAKFYAHGITEYGFGANPATHNSDYMTVYPKGRNNKTGTSSDSGGILHPEEYQTFGHLNAWNHINGTPEGRRLTFTSIWNLFDFAVGSRNEGGTPGINDKGLVTRDRKIKKDAFYLYKCAWNPEAEVHIISSRWKERDTKDITINVFSNCDKLVLSYNGKEVQTLDKPDDPRNNILWTFNPITFSSDAASGKADTFKVVGYRNGQIVKTDTASFSTTAK